MSKYDVVIIGSGPGGYVAAIRAAQLGLKTAIVEREHLGGICLHWGCIPTKALLRSAEVYHLLEHLDEFGLSAQNPSFDIGAIVKRSRKISKRLGDGVKFLLRKNKVDVVLGEGRLGGSGVVVETGDGRKELASANVIVATGARARVLDGLKPDGEAIWDYKNAMVPEALPRSLLVVGAGAIGVEFASFYRSFGAEVCLLETAERILPVEDAEISALAREAFEKQGMRVLTGATLVSAKVESKGKSVRVRMKDGEGKETEEVFERVISAVGIVGNIENIGLEEAGVRTERGHIKVDAHMLTGAPNIYAIGDVAGPPWLAHKANHEGVLAVERIAGYEGAHPIDYASIPGCTYCRPQIASIGMTEEAAAKAGHKLRIGRFPFIGNGKALALGDSEGLVKTIFDEKTGALLGAHMIGAEVTELIQGYAIARTLESTEAELMRTVFPHPTLSEMMHESVLDAYGHALHM
ncbi:MAG: dihydrolipoyl dehydrogenase [Hyphomicrobiales bacterium]|nr:dihydrolipoyl dehydrogenase [Hyphomicrobiales bacterium]